MTLMPYAARLARGGKLRAAPCPLLPCRCSRSCCTALLWTRQRRTLGRQGHRGHRGRQAGARRSGRGKAGFQGTVQRRRRRVGLGAGNRAHQMPSGSDGRFLSFHVFCSVWLSGANREDNCWLGSMGGVGQCGQVVAGYSAV